MLPEDISKVEEIITKAGVELKAIEVNKSIPLEIDCGNLLVSDINELEKTRFRNECQQSNYLKELARDGVQVLINKVWDLPSDNINNAIYALMPQPTFRLPREKPVPKPRPPTKWELFAKEKGIKKKKKTGKEWDDIVKEWVPRYGYRKVAAEKKKNWLMEVPDNRPYEDQFAKAAEAKKERIARNDYLRLKNIARAKNVKVPSVGVTAATMTSSSEIKAALLQARMSTASLGKFQSTLRRDIPLFQIKQRQKRKLPANDTSAEGIHKDKKRALEVLTKMKKKELDYEAAVNKQIRLENIELSHAERVPKSVRRSKRGQQRKRKSNNPKKKAKWRVLTGNLANDKENKATKASGGGKGNKSGGLKAKGNFMRGNAVGGSRGKGNFKRGNAGGGLRGKENLFKRRNAGGEPRGKGNFKRGNAGGPRGKGNFKRGNAGGGPRGKGNFKRGKGRKCEYLY